VARQLAEEAQRLVIASRASSASRHDLAAEAHERAAAVGSGDVALHLTKALGHRLAAQNDRNLNTS
jgi:cytochrome b561